MKKNHEKIRKGINRRQAIKYSIKGATIGTMGSLLPHSTKADFPNLIRKRSKDSKVAVVGAGAFGGWTALHLLRMGYDVTLIDQFGPGNSQASSGGETRLIRPFYGDQEVYFNMVLRSLELWTENEEKMNEKILYQNGLVIFNQAASNPRVEDALPMYKKAGLRFEKISPDEAAKRWPQIKTSDLDHVMYDPVAGFLKAREGCKAVRDLFVKEGGNFIQDQVAKENIAGGKANSLSLTSGTTIEADSFVFACGPWLTRLFPEMLNKLNVTRQACFFFASPPGQSDLMENKLPTWFNRDLDGVFGAYGVPGSDYRGFKIAFELEDIITDKFDTYHRYVKPEEQEHAKKILALRFPKMAGRPLLDQRVCQYTETPDRNFILDKHPLAPNLWIMGGGSGHGYKHGASFGEMAAQSVSGEREVMDMFALNRLLT
ncbi:glycine/D-amino acid oxidase-like deaminating enzyme [Catalinimonas alkaloidigena]|uniref:NAD(P)/FAD-dependent oxidoreductase n=1 Tax=Catalinimonas alkaloidigena TaxID=1075417 RepID=UPI002405F58E|nr:FAD-dependent oxidoreductase [Catalinimonas alkaloidigena]MDF9799267.1 glycine/D-amino acid oxidase-like deaminating enzyme [Catalinimonas alkaloidigena]